MTNTDNITLRDQRNNDYITNKCIFIVVIIIFTGKLTWDSEDDEAIEQNLTKLNKKYGEKRVMSRAAND
jgi:hypothetical protein